MFFYSFIKRVHGCCSCIHSCEKKTIVLCLLLLCQSVVVNRFKRDCLLLGKSHLNKLCVKENVESKYQIFLAGCLIQNLQMFCCCVKAKCNLYSALSPWAYWRLFAQFLLDIFCSGRKKIKTWLKL